MAAPEEMPTGIPSIRAAFRAVAKAVSLGNGDDLVDHLAVEDGGHETGADALDLVRTGLAAGEHRRILGLQRDHLDARLLGLQHLADAGDGAAGADAEMT